MPTPVTMPALSPTMTEGTLAKWLKSEGDAVESGDVIAEIETDKATMEVEAVDEGILAKILVSEGTENVPVNDVIAVLLEEGESADDVDMSSLQTGIQPAKDSGQEDKRTGGLDDQRSPEQSSNSQILESSNTQLDRVFASPLARRIAKDKGVDIAQIKGSGPRGRVVKDDVESYKGASKSAQSASGAAVTTDDEFTQTNIFGMAYKEIPNNNIKKVTARRLTEAKQEIPHFYLTVEMMLDNLLEARKELNAQADGAYKISVNDFIIKAAAMALKAYPAANVSWSDDALQQFKHADISVAVSTPNGLITPIVRNAEEKGLAQISKEMKELAGRAREGKLKPEEFQGGSFSISNLGMFGVQEFQAIINPPQSCIMAVGAGVQKPVVVDGKIEVRTVMSITLSTDHRSVDGAVGAEYLQHFKRYIENPVSMLV